MPDPNLRFIQVFREKNTGNRIIFPSLAWDPSGETLWMSIRLRALSIASATGLELESGALLFDPKNIPHVPMSIVSRAFQHGGADCLCVGGPDFDAHALPEQIADAAARNVSLPFEWRDGTLRLSEPTPPTPTSSDPDPRCPICNEPKSHGHLFPECVM